MRRIGLCASMYLIVVGSANANNGDQMVGFSALSNAMGGAVTATPQDVTTSLSNPAGLATLDLGRSNTRFDMNLALLNPIRELNGVSSDNDIYVMATGGFAFRNSSLGDRLTFAVGAYPVSGGGVDFPSHAFTAPVNGSPSPVSIVASRQSLRIGPAVAYKVTDNFTLGGNISLVSNMMSVKGMTNFPTDVAYGASFVLGATYDITDQLRFGAAYTSKTYSEDLNWNLNNGAYSLSFDDPQTIALGLSYAPSDRLMVEADLKWLNYSNVRAENDLITPPSMPDQKLTYGWDDQYVIALGVKYALTGKYSLLAGYNYGASPLKEDDINNNIGVTAIVEHHLSGGISAQMTKFTTLSFSVIHGYSNEMTASVGPPTKVKFETNLASLQFTYKF